MTRSMFCLLALWPVLFTPQQEIAGQHRKVFSSASHALTAIHAYGCDNAANNASGSKTCAITATASGDGLMVACAQYVGTSLTISPSLATVIGPTNPASDRYYSLYLTSPVSTGTTSITFTGAGSYQTIFCLVIEVSGVKSSQNIDPGGSAVTALTETAYGTGSSTSLTGAVTTTYANDSVCAVMGQGTSTVTPVTPGTGYTILGTVNSSNSNATLSIECLTTPLSATASGVNPGYTWTNSGKNTVGTFAVELQ